MKKILLSGIVAITTVVSAQTTVLATETTQNEKSKAIEVSLNEVKNEIKPIRFGGNNKFSASRNSKYEYFKFTVTNQGYVNITCDRALFSGAKEDDIRLTLMDESGQKIFLDGYNKYTKYKDNKTFSFKIGLTPGDYYGRFYVDSSINTGEMELNYKADFIQDNNFELESYRQGYNYDTKLKKDIKINQLYKGISNESADDYYKDEDFYTFTIDKKGTYAIETEVLLNAEYTIELKDRYDRSIYKFVNNGGKKHKNLFKELSPGDYYLSISNYTSFYDKGPRQKEYSFKISEARNGWIKENNLYYYFKDDQMQTGFIEVDGSKYFLDVKTGAMKTGWLNDYNTWYYLNSSGAAQTGWYYDGYDWYYFNKEGQMQVELTVINGVTYYFNESGVMQTGWLSNNGTWYYLNSSGAAQTGWLSIGYNWYFFDANGKMQVGKKQIDGSEYYFNPSGVMLTGWQNRNSGWYYYGTSGAMQIGWYHDGHDWYYLNDDNDYYASKGEALTGNWTIGGSQYYFNSSGVMQTGWEKIGYNWRYYNSSGVMQKGWLQLGGNWYYMNSNGNMVTGTNYINGSYEYFNSNGVWLG